RRGGGDRAGHQLDGDFPGGGRGGPALVAGQARLSEPPAKSAGSHREGGRTAHHQRPGMEDRQIEEGIVIHGRGGHPAPPRGGLRAVSPTEGKPCCSLASFFSTCCPCRGRRTCWPSS